MTALRDRIIFLRREASLSIKEIAKRLGCGKSTASMACQGIVPKDPERLRRNIIANAKFSSDANKAKWAKVIESTTKEAAREWPAIKRDPLLMGFIGLYWGEGNKQNGSFSVSNNDHGLIMVAYAAMLKLGMTKVYARIRYYEDHDPAALKMFWSTLLPTAIVQLKLVTDPRSGKKVGKAKYGLCMIGGGNKKLLTKVMYWIGRWKTDSGVLAHLGERNDGIVETEGSNPSHSIAPLEVNDEEKEISRC